MAYSNQHYPLEPNFIPVSITPLRYGEGPGEYETQYRHSVQQYNDDKKTTHAIVQPIDIPQGEVPNYKPGPLRWPMLFCMLVALLGLIVGTEYACRALPAEEVQRPMPTTASPRTSTSAIAPSLRRRQDEVVTPSGTVGDTTPTPSGDDAPQVTVSIAPQSDFGEIGSVAVTVTPTPAATQPKSNYGKDGEVTVTSAAPKSNYGQDGSVTIPTPSPSAAAYGDDGRVTITSIPAPTPTYVSAEITVLTGTDGVPSATQTIIPTPISIPTTLIQTDSVGIPTATLITSMLASPVTSILTNSLGQVTATATLYPSLTPDTQVPQVQVYYISRISYFIGFFLPPLICVLLTIPIRMIDMAAKQFQPFHEMTRRSGASAKESLLLQTGGLLGVVNSARSLLGGRPLVFLTTVLSICSAVLVPLSTEAIGLNLHGVCGEMDFNGCAMTLGVFLTPARATIGLLAFMVVVVGCLAVFMVRWRSGVATNPWSIGGIAGLSTNEHVRGLFAGVGTGRDGRVSERRMKDVLDGRRFRLGWFWNRNGEAQYGVTICDEVGRGLQGPQAAGYAAEEVGGQSRGSRRGHHLPFLMLTYAWRVAFLVFLSGLLAVILYYNFTGGDTPFERFMDTQSFGVRFLFTLFGVAISFFWSSFFSSVATISPYHLLAQHPQLAENSILLSPSLHAVTGIWSAIRRRHHFLVWVAITAILSEFMPILLNNVPMRVTQTWVTHLVCTWLAVAILALMWFVVMASFFIKWPHMPVDPSTVAGSMWYVCDSWMLYGFEGTSTMRKRERDYTIADMGLSYEYGEIQGISGLTRYGVDGVRTP